MDMTTHDNRIHDNYIALTLFISMQVPLKACRGQTGTVSGNMYFTLPWCSVACLDLAYSTSLTRQNTAKGLPLF